ncbi:restriction endonuclease subunit S [Streptomyces erythrochromogenes]|uniref:restriction endonuclease subunit S n=1 Tax=Streptomyces erythrochromogenes TaxID=285574 RepID=UPI0036BC7FE1
MSTTSLPAGWRTARLGFLVETHVPQRDKPDPLDGPIPWVRIEDFEGQEIRSSKSGQGVTSEQVSGMNLRVLSPGTVLCSCSCSMGATAIVREPLVSNQTFIGLTPGPEVESRFLYYLMYAMGDRLQAMATGAIQQYLSRDDFRSLRVPLPPLWEQCQIADFLDGEVGRLNVIVRSQERLYELLDERIGSQVLNVIGRSELGNPGAGERLVAMRRLLGKVVRPPADTREVVTAFRDGQVTARSLRRAEGYTQSVSNEPQGQWVAVDDVVVHGLDGFAGAIGASEADGNCSPVYHVMTPEGDGDPLYYGRLLRILALQGYLTGFSYSTRERAFDFRNWDMFGRIPLPVTDADEQRRIGDQIRKIRPLRTKLDQFGERIAERRRVLITAAVTGQFDVSTASGRNVTEGITV